MNQPPILDCVVPAAGIGRRFGATVPKQYLPLAGQLVIEHSLQRLLAISQIRRVVVALDVDDERFHTLDISQDRRIETVAGGAERQQSVLNGLNHCLDSDSPPHWVLVHDVARPCIRPADVTQLIQAVWQQVTPEHGGLLAIPVRDTMKRGSSQAQIEATVPRENLWQAQTPQLFPAQALASALAVAAQQGLQVTDEASAMEYQGLKPLLVPGHSDNLKITMPEDLVLAELYLQAQLSTEESNV